MTKKTVIPVTNKRPNCIDMLSWAYKNRGNLVYNRQYVKEHSLFAQDLPLHFSPLI